MTTDPFTEAARAEFYRVWHSPIHDHSQIGMAIHMAEWARDHLAAREPTDAEVETMARMTTEESYGYGWETWSEASRDCYRATARRRMSAARAARWDEKDTP